MARKPRSYAAEYAARLARGAAKNLSRSAARGHARAGEQTAGSDRRLLRERDLALSRAMDRVAAGGVAFLGRQGGAPLSRGSSPLRGRAGGLPARRRSVPDRARPEAGDASPLHRRHGAPGYDGPGECNISRPVHGRRWPLPRNQRRYQACSVRRRWCRRSQRSPPRLRDQPRSFVRLGRQGRSALSPNL